MRLSHTITRGFSYIELCIVMLIFSIGLSGAAAIIQQSREVQRLSFYYQIAAELAATRHDRIQSQLSLPTALSLPFLRTTKVTSLSDSVQHRVNGVVFKEQWRLQAVMPAATNLPELVNISRQLVITISWQDSYQDKHQFDASYRVLLLPQQSPSR